MLKRSARAVCTLAFALALLVASCVEVEVRRSLDEDLAGRQTITVRAPAGATEAAELFPGSFSAARVLPAETRRTADGVVRSAQVVFADVTRLRHRVGFLHASATVETAGDGTAQYRETLGNGYLNSLEKAPDQARKQIIAAECEKAKAALAKASLTYTIRFPGDIVRSNADRVSGREATWALTVAKLFAGRTLELSADYRVPAPPQVAAASARAPAAPAPRGAEPANPIEPPRIASPAPVPAARLAPTVLGQAGEGEPKPAGEAPAPSAAEEKPLTLDDEPGDDEATRKLKALFRQAFAALDLKDYEKAAKALQEAIALKPDSATVADYYRLAVAKYLDAGLQSENAELKAAAEKLQRIAYEGRIRQLRQPDYINQLCDKLSQGFFPRTIAMEELVLAGDYAVPHLINYIKRNPDPQRRAYASHVLARLGRVAVLPICEALKLPDARIRQIVVHALETIGDGRAIPALLATAQDPKAHPLVVESARKALVEMAKDPAVLNTPASVAFLALAEDFYEQDQRVLVPHLYEHLVWRYDPDTQAIEPESVPRPLYPYRVAEELCRNAVLANPDFEQAVPLIACIYFAQQSFLDDFFESIEGQAMTPALANEAALARPIRERLRSAPHVAHAAGRKHLYAALQRSLRDGRTDVAVRCILAVREIADGTALPEPPPPPEVLAQMEQEGEGAAKPRPRRPILTWFGPKVDDQPPPPKEQPKNPYAVPLDGTPLIQALSYAPHRRVRYAAAEAIVAINPTHMIVDAEKVITNLSEALAETAERVALLVDDDQARADQLRGLLRDVAIVPVLAHAQRDALQRGTELPPKDLVIVSAHMKEVDVVTLLDTLRRVPSLAAKPAVVVTTKAELPELQKTLKGKGVAFLTSPFDKQSVQELVDRLLPKPKSTDLAAAYAASAARTLASIDPDTSVFRVADALPGLLRAVASRTHPDEVRIPACRAIQRIAAERACPYLVSVFNDPKSSKPLRLATLEAMGACAAAAKEVPGDVFGILTRTAYHSDFDYRQAAARGLGLSGGAGHDLLRVIDYLQGRKKGN